MVDMTAALIALLKGSFRSITGYIGKTHREGYGISTATATIGIRGTDHEPAYFPPPEAGQKGDQEPGTYDKVNRGETYIRNPHGEVAVSRGQSAFVHQEGSQAPRLLQQVPRFYREHAKFDRAAADRRREFHQTHEAEQRRLQQEQRKERQQQKSHNPRQPGKTRARAGQRK